MDRNKARTNGINAISKISHTLYPDVVDDVGGANDVAPGNCDGSSLCGRFTPNPAGSAKPADGRFSNRMMFVSLFSHVPEQHPGSH